MLTSAPSRSIDHLHWHAIKSLVPHRAVDLCLVLDPRITPRWRRRDHGCFDGAWHIGRKRARAASQPSGESRREARARAAAWSHSVIHRVTNNATRHFAAVPAARRAPSDRLADRPHERDCPQDRAADSPLRAHRASRISPAESGARTNIWRRWRRSSGIARAACAATVGSRWAVKSRPEIMVTRFDGQRRATKNLANQFADLKR